MTRFCALFLLPLQLVVSALATEPHYVDEQDPWLQQHSVFDNLRSTKTEVAPISETPVSRIPTTNMQLRKGISIREVKPVTKLGYHERLAAVKSGQSQIRRVQYDFDKIHQLFQHDAASGIHLPVDSSPGFFEPSIELERTYKVAAPPRPDVQSDSSSDRVESKVGQLRHGGRREIRGSDGQNQMAQEALREELGEVVDLDDVVEAEDSAVAEVLSGPKNVADPLDLTLEFKDPQHDVSAINNWHHSSLTLSAEQEHFDPCESDNCEQMWDCAGGRCATWIERMKRNLDRTYQLTIGRCRGSRRFAPGNRTLSAFGKTIGCTEISPGIVRKGP